MLATTSNRANAAHMLITLVPLVKKSTEKVIFQFLLCLSTYNRIGTVGG
jgi:hypothetical protein